MEQMDKTTSMKQDFDVQLWCEECMVEAWEQRDYAQRLFFCRCPSCHPHIPPYAFELVAPLPLFSSLRQRLTRKHGWLTSTLRATIWSHQTPHLRPTSRIRLPSSNMYFTRPECQPIALPGTNVPNQEATASTLWISSRNVA